MSHFLSQNIYFLDHLWIAEDDLGQLEEIIKTMANKMVLRLTIDYLPQDFKIPLDIFIVELDQYKLKSLEIKHKLKLDEK